MSKNLKTVLPTVGALQLVSTSLIVKMASCFAALALLDNEQKERDLSSLRLKQVALSAGCQNSPAQPHL